MKLNFYVLLSIICVSNAENILIIQNVFAHSYSYVLQGIANILATEHNITLISRHPLQEANPNITVLQLRPLVVNVAGLFKDVFEISLKQGGDTSQIGIDAALFDTKEYTDEIMNDPATQYIFQTKGLYDILIMPTVLSGPFVRFAHYLNVPLVQVAASHPMPWQNDVIGNPSYVSTDASLLLQPNLENFLGRLLKSMKGLQLLYRYYFEYLPNTDKYSEQYFPPNTPKTEAILQNTSLLLVNTQDQMIKAGPKVPNYVQIGGLHCRPAKDLPRNLQQFAQNAHPGLIYMSLGLTINSTFPRHILRGILNVFRKLPQKVIFKMGEEITNIPSNVLILKSSPQQDILGHPNTKLFIMQGGMLSLQEAVFHQVPVLILPLALDQPSNAVLVDKLGYGRYLRLSQFSEDAFYRDISEILSNSKYKKRVQELSALTKDVFKDPKENLRWWIKYIIRNSPSAKHNRHEYNFSTYQIDVDILAFLFSFILFLFLSFRFILVFIIRFVNAYSKIKKD